MVKFLRKTLRLFGTTALALLGTGILLAEKTPSSATAKADEPSANATLVAPVEYEQYLRVADGASFSDAAVSESYTAIAEGNKIYVYDRLAKNYEVYEHVEKVNKLQFTDNGLYFLDAAMYLYELDESTLVSTNLQFTCTDFFAAGDRLFFTAVSGQEGKISLTSLSDPDPYVTPLKEGLQGKPISAYWNGYLYYTNAGQYLYKLDPTSPETSQALLADFTLALTSFVVSDNILACSDVTGKFSAYSLGDLMGGVYNPTPLFSDKEGYGAISLSSPDVYAVRQNVVRQFSLDSKTFTDYEIGSASSSVNRLNGATELLLKNGKLFIADAGNDRISIYDTRSSTFSTPLPVDFSPEFLASDGETTLLAADRERAVLYSLDETTFGTKLAAYPTFNGELRGITCVDGVYYFVTESNRCYVSQTDDAWQLHETKKNVARYVRHFTSDAYGNLYVASGANVYRYTEAEFLDPNDEGERVTDALPLSSQKIAVDYDGNVYALCGNTLAKIGGETHDFSTPLVYESEVHLQSFAFDVEENVTFLLYKENHAAKTTALNLPTVKTIAVQDADEGVFSATSAEIEILQNEPNALAVQFDIHALQGAETFPYIAHSRWKTPVNLLKIGETDVYNVVALYDNETRHYATYLLLKTACRSLPSEEYRTDYETPRTGWLSNAVALYKFPYLTTLLTVTELPRGATVEVLGEIDRLDHPYYFVRYKTNEGTSFTGYLPQTFVADFDGTPPQANVETLGTITTDKDSVWRFAYLLLGTCAICILVDYLLLRNVKEDE